MATAIAPITDWVSDPDLLGPLLVAEVEAYLKSQARLRVRPTTPSRPRLTVPHVPRYGSVVQQWHHGIELPELTLMDRLRGRRQVAEVTVRQHLQLMSNYIHQHGWARGLLWDARGQVCLLGAQIRIVAAGYSTPQVAEHARLLIGNEIGYLTGGQGVPIDTWNDAEGRAKNEIHALLRATAARIR